MSANQSNNNPTRSWRELRAQERQERRAARGNNGWIFGVVLVLVGALLFLQNMNMFTLNNWWALFILLPGFGALAGAWRMFRETGEVTGGVIGALLLGVLLIGISLAFVLNLSLDWTNLLPVVLVLAGVSLLIPSLFGRR